MTKVYISGRISGLPMQEVKRHFNDFEAMIDNIGNFEAVNPLKNGIAENEAWETHLKRDIDLLLECDAILMLDGWKDSHGARIEYEIASKKGMTILFEATLVRVCEETRNKKAVVNKIQNAIFEVTKKPFKVYSERSREHGHFCARMLFAYHCRQSGMTLTEIAKYLHRDHSSIIHLLKKYDDDVRFNRHFQEMAIKVDNILKNNDR